MKKTILIVALLMALLLCGCQGEEGSAVKETEEVIQTEEVKDTEPEKTIEVVNNIYGDKTEYSNGGSSEIYITAPKVVAPEYGEAVDALNEIIEMNVDTIKDEYLREASINKDAEGADSSSRMMVYETYFAEDGLVSILLNTTYYNQASGHSSHLYKSINFDLSSGKELTLSDFANSEAVKTMILTKMQENPDKYLSTDESIIDVNYIERAFLFNGERVYVYFDEYMIAPKLEGFQMFDFTFEELA